MVEDLVTVSKEAKILGVTWSQPRFWKGKIQMFQKDAEEAMKKIKEVQAKMRRLKVFKCYLDRTTQNIIVNTYLFAKIKYGMVIMWDLINKTRKTKINSMLRSCTKGIRDCTIQSENRFFQVVECYEPLGLKILQRMVKIQQKLEYYYYEEHQLFNELWEEEDYWK